MKKTSLSTKKLVYTATLTAICTIFNTFTFLPVKDFAISFVALPCFVAGAFLGPLNGFAVGILGDLLGCIIHPQGPYLPLIGIASGMLGLIPGLVFQYSKNNHYIKIVISFVLTLIICTMGLNTYALWSAYGKTSFLAYLSVRLPFQIIVNAMNAGLAFAVFIPLNRFVFKLGWDTQEKLEKEEEEINSRALEVNLSALDQLDTQKDNTKDN